MLQLAKVSLLQGWLPISLFSVNGISLVLLLFMKTKRGKKMFHLLIQLAIGVITFFCRWNNCLAYFRRVSCIRSKSWMARYFFYCMRLWTYRFCSNSTRFLTQMEETSCSNSYYFDITKHSSSSRHDLWRIHDNRFNIWNGRFSKIRS